MNDITKILLPILILISIIIISCLCAWKFIIKPYQETVDLFCKEHSFNEAKLSADKKMHCIDEHRISDKAIICDDHFLRANNCRWERQLKIVEVDTNG